MIRTTRIFVLLTLLTATSSCAAVAPWERGVFADPCMAVSVDPEEELIEQHLFAYREGSAGGSGDTGGGCGCN